MCRALKDGLQGPCPVLSSTGPKMMEEGLYMDMPGIQARYGRSLAAWVWHTLCACVPRSIYLHLPWSGAQGHQYQALVSTPHQGRGFYDTLLEGPAQPSSTRDIKAFVTPDNAQTCLVTPAFLVFAWFPQDRRMLGSQAYVQGIERRPAMALPGALKHRAKDD